MKKRVHEPKDRSEENMQTKHTKEWKRTERT